MSVKTKMLYLRALVKKIMNEYGVKNKMHNLGVSIKEKMINFALQKRWTIILSLYLVVIYYSESWFTRNVVLREYQETFNIVISLYLLWGMFKAIKSFFEEDESSCFEIFCVMGLIPIVALLDNLINAESQLLNTYLVIPILVIIWRSRRLIKLYAEVFFKGASAAKGNRKGLWESLNEVDDKYDTSDIRKQHLKTRRERREFGGSSFTYSNKAEPSVETKADNRKTVYEVHVRTGAAGYQRYTSMDTLAKAEWAADQMRKKGKEVQVVPIFK